MLTHDPDTNDLAKDFTTRFASPTRRCGRRGLADESAVLGRSRKPQQTLAFRRLASSSSLASGFDDTDAHDGLANARDDIWAISAAVRAVVGGWHGKSPRMWLVTRNGLVVHGDERGDPAVGALKGLIRVLAYEHPDLRTTLVDLHASDDAVATLTAELESPGNDDLIAWRGERRYVERLARATLGARERDPVVRSDGSYIVTGGLGGVGMVVARWLVDSGAARVVLNGRSDPSESQRTNLAELETRAEVVVIQGDIASPGMAERLVAAAEETGRQLRGVVHRRPWLTTRSSPPSAGKAWNVSGPLRRWAHGGCIKPPPTESSTGGLASVGGVPAGLAGAVGLRQRERMARCSGVVAKSVGSARHHDQLGPVGGHGNARSLTLDVLDPISPAEGIEALNVLLAGTLTQVGVARLRLDRAAAAFPEIQQLGYFASLAGELETEGDDDWSGPEALRDMDPSEVNGIVTARLRRRVSAIMGYPDDRGVATDQPLTGLGMDSLMAVRIRDAVPGDFGVEPPVALLLQGASLEEVTTDLLGQLGLAGDGNTEPTNEVRDRAHQRAAARQRAAMRRRGGQRV